MTSFLPTQQRTPTGTHTHTHTPAHVPTPTHMHPNTPPPHTSYLPANPLFLPLPCSYVPFLSIRILREYHGRTAGIAGAAAIGQGDAGSMSIYTALNDAQQRRAQGRRMAPHSDPCRWITRPTPARKQMSCACATTRHPKTPSK